MFGEQVAEKDRRIATLEDACRAAEPTGTPSHVVQTPTTYVQCTCPLKNVLPSWLNSLMPQCQCRSVVPLCRCGLRSAWLVPLWRVCRPAPSSHGAIPQLIAPA